MGKFIAIDGLDGSGKGTQSEKLVDYLRSIGKKVRVLSFPMYENESSAFVKMYLDGKLGDKPSDTNAYTASMFFASDRYISYVTDWKKDILDPEKIEKWSKGVKNGNTADNIQEIAFAEHLLDLWNKALDLAECDEHRAHIRQSRIQALYYAEFVLPAERFDRLNKVMLDEIRASGIIRYRETSTIPDIENKNAYPDLR